MKTFTYLGALAFSLLLSLQLATAAETPEPATEAQHPELTVSFNFQRGGIASSQYAVWIENKAGEVVRTIFVTRFTVRKGYRTRPDALPLWVKQADRASMTDAEVDAVSGATPRNGALTYTWDGLNDQGERVADGEYRLFVEGTLYWKSRILFSGEFQWGSATKEEVPLTTEHFNRQPENGLMLTSVHALYTPKAE